MPTISIDLLAAAGRSDSFPADITGDQIERARDRYERFLLLAQQHEGPLAPTRDIDSMWHLHMLSPRAYYEDCMRLFGHILDHDGGFGKAPEEVPELAATFERTAALWMEAYGEVYWVPSADERGAGMVSCKHDCQSRCWHACKSVDAQPTVSQ